MTVKGNILNMHDQLSAAEQRIAAYVSQNASRVIEMNVKQLAQETQTSPATVSRFARSLNFSSYNELKLQLSSDLHDPEAAVMIDPEIKAAEPLESITAKLLMNAEKSLHETIDQVRQSTVDLLVQQLKKARQIVCFGIGASFLVAQNIAQKWSRLGMAISATDDLNQVLPVAGAPHIDRKLFWLISNSGETPEVVLAAQLIHEAGGQVVAMTTLGDNALSREADIAIQTSEPAEGMVRFAATQSLHAQFMLVDVVYYAFVSQNYEASRSAVTNSRKLVNRYKATFLDGIKHHA